jgi:hypothetical protein
MKAKPILVVLVTLIIGFVLGMLTSAQIRYHRLNPVRVFFSEERFREGFYKAIQPDGKQKEKIDIILNKYAKINSEIQGNFRKELEANMKEFRKELDLNLTKEQLERLKQMDERRQEIIRLNRKNRPNDTLSMRDERWRNPGRRSAPKGTQPAKQDNDTAKLPDNK